MSKWESGRGYPEIEKILYICNRYHVSIADLFAQEAPIPAAAAPVSEAMPESAALPRATLRSAVGAFLTNLSPKNKWLAAAVLLGIGALSLIIGLILKGGNADMATTIWIAAIIIFGIAEAATAGLVSIWFVVGAVAALVATELGAALWLQFAVFLIVSILALIATRPLARKMLDKTIVPTNADRVLHHEAKVTETVDNENATGAVYIDGKTWTARSEDGNIIPKGKKARIVRMEGVKRYVRESKEPSERRE